MRKSQQMMLAALGFVVAVMVAFAVWIRVVAEPLPQLSENGRLTGDMSGSGNLEYYGTVSEESVDTSGFVDVRRRD